MLESRLWLLENKKTVVKPVPFKDFTVIGNYLHKTAPLSVKALSTDHPRPMSLFESIVRGIPSNLLHCVSVCRSPWYSMVWLLDLLSSYWLSTFRGTIRSLSRVRILSAQLHSYNKKWERKLPFFVSLKQLLLKISSLAKSRIENSLSDTERNRGNLEQLIDIDEVECLFQT